MPAWRRVERASVTYLTRRTPICSALWDSRTTSDSLLIMKSDEGPVKIIETCAVRAHNLLEMWVTDGLLLREIFDWELGLGLICVCHCIASRNSPLERHMVSTLPDWNSPEIVIHKTKKKPKKLAGKGPQCRLHNNM